jgi:hypothetical protein
MQPPEPLERRSARRKVRFYGLERLQRVRSGDSGSCGGDTVAVQDRTSRCTRRSTASEHDIRERRRGAHGIAVQFGWL